MYNDAIFDGLDFLLAEMAKRDMYAVLYFNNSWEWSGGYTQYLEWAGYGKAPIPAIDGGAAYMKYADSFFQSEIAMVLFNHYVKDVVTRTNRYTGKKYTEDPAIMSWQIGNEPRAFSESNKPRFAKWISEVATLIKSLDSNHLVSTGSEGKYGCERDMLLFEQIHGYPEIDYINIHIWPYNWGWAGAKNLQNDTLLLGLRLREGIDRAVLGRGVEPALLGFVERGLLQIVDERIQLTEDGRLLADGIITDLLIAENQ